IREDDVWGLRSAVDAAWGVTYPQPLPQGANPMENDTGVPVQIWWANDDPTSVGATTYASNVGAEIYDLGALGHTDEAIQAVDVEVVSTFIDSVLDGTWTPPEIPSDPPAFLTGVNGESQVDSNLDLVLTVPAGTTSDDLVVAILQSAQNL